MIEGTDEKFLKLFAISVDFQKPNNVCRHFRTQLRVSKYTLFVSLKYPWVHRDVCARSYQKCLEGFVRKINNVYFNLF